MHTTADFGRLLALGTLLLAGCGGNSGGDPPAGPDAQAEGAWSGSNSLANVVDLLVLEDGTLYALYGSNGSAGFTPLGFDVGHTAVSGSTLSGGVTQYDFGGNRVTGQLQATVATGSSINGVATPSNGGPPTTFFVQPMAQMGPGYAYAYGTPAKPADMAMAWSGRFLGGAAATFSVDADGTLASSGTGCSFSGSVLPRASGKNVFNLSLHFGPAPCPLADQDASGIAIVSGPVATTGTRQWLAALENTAKTQGTVLAALH